MSINVIKNNATKLLENKQKEIEWYYSNNTLKKWAIK